MADTNLNALPQPSTLGSDEGNVWLTSQYCYHAEVQADRGGKDGQANAHDQLDRARTQLEKITGSAAHDTATAYYNSAVDYVAQKAALDQGDLGAISQAQDNSVTQGNALSPDQQAALEADNNAWAFAKSAQDRGENPDLAYVEAKTSQAVDDSVNNLKKTLEPLSTSLKFAGLGVGIAIGLIVVIVILVKVA